MPPHVRLMRHLDETDGTENQPPRTFPIQQMKDERDGCTYRTGYCIAPDGEDLRIHLHTTEPADAYAAADEAGRIRVFRAVDMRMQAARTHESESDAAVVAVVQGSGFVRVFTELGAAAIVSGGAADNPSVEMLFKLVPVDIRYRQCGTSCTAPIGQ